MNATAKLRSVIVLAVLAACGGQLPEAGGEEARESSAAHHQEASSSVNVAVTWACDPFPCPPGSLYGGPSCSILCPTSYCLTVGGFNSSICYWPAGTLSASPQTVSLQPGQVGSSSICYSTNDYARGAQVFVSTDGGAEALFATTTSSACQDAPWIQIGHSYAFRMYDGTAHQSLLANVTVTGVLAPPPCTGVCQPGQTQTFDCGRCGDGTRVNTCNTSCQWVYGSCHGGHSSPCP